ncbi:ankyrin repeat domain-containing protein, partial [Klebsiella pneumoniae]|uniref:ankyrin repeat domain-containing protein n=1 Tax=Klebsiella pneumoniae TaxID=573 RepID=UPI003013B9C1
GMTPLVFAVSTDRPNSEIIRLLLSKGADPSIQTNEHESAIDWARKFNNPAVLHELKLQPVPVGGRDVVVQAEGKTARQAVEL